MNCNLNWRLSGHKAEATSALHSNWEEKQEGFTGLVRLESHTVHNPGLSHRLDHISKGLTV
jgi:hypothetical protein